MTIHFIGNNTNNQGLSLRIQQKEFYLKFFKCTHYLIKKTGKLRVGPPICPKEWDNTVASFMQLIVWGVPRT